MGHWKRNTMFIVAAGIVLLTAVVEFGARLLVSPRPFFHNASADRSAVLPHGRNIAYRLFVPRANVNHAAIVFIAHGIGDSSLAQVGFASQLRDRGFIVVAPDLLGHGLSSRVPLRFGPTDALAFQAVLRSVRAETQSDGPVFGVGTSYGGSAINHFAALERQVARLAIISSFAALKNILPSYERRFLGFSFPNTLEELVLWRAAQVAGGDMDVRPVAALAHACARGVSALVLHGGVDERIPISEGERLAQGCGVALTRIAGAGHDDVLAHPEAMAALIDFLERR